MGIAYTCGDRGQDGCGMVGGRVCHVSIFSPGLICKTVAFFLESLRGGRERFRWGEEWELSGGAEREGNLDAGW